MPDGWATPSAGRCALMKIPERSDRAVTARDEDADIAAGLRWGADYALPSRARILTARIKAVLRLGPVEPEDEKETLTCDRLIDWLHHTVHVDGQLLELTLSEFKALELFAKRPGVVFSRYQIVDAIHGKDYPVTDRLVDVLIVGLRRKLGDYGEWIETRRGGIPNEGRVSCDQKNTVLAVFRRACSADRGGGLCGLLYGSRAGRPTVNSAWLRANWKFRRVSLLLLSDDGTGGRAAAEHFERLTQPTHIALRLFCRMGGDRRYRRQGGPARSR